MMKKGLKEADLNREKNLESLISIQLTAMPYTYL